MKFSFNLLKRYINFNKEYSKEEISHHITSLGLEVEEIENLGVKYNNFVVAEIIEASKHPESEKLTLCKVNTGTEVLNVVCGAHNARKGIFVILAKIGAIVPESGMEIKKGVIRGQESNGMLCSASELMLDEEKFGSKEGIIELPFEASHNVGMKLAEYLGLNEDIFHISITPNRGDACSINGITRDLAAKSLGIKQTTFVEKSLKKFPLQEVKAEERLAGSLKSVNFGKIYLPSKLPEEVLKEIKEYQKIWGTAGNLFVDLGNLNMFLTGLPMHIYDLAKIEGKVCIRRSLEGEKLVPIKGEEMLLPAGLAVVADGSKILSLLGVMGDARSKVTEGTKEVLIEVLHIKPEEVMNSSRKTGLKSDSSYRFERGIDFTMCLNALNTFIAKLGVLACEEFSYQAPLNKVSIEFSAKDYLAKIGVPIEGKKIKEILEALGFEVLTKGEEILVHVPPFRPDITIKEDLCEEIARIIGLDAIPALPIKNMKPVENIDITFEIKKVLSEGLNEIITFSFFKDEFYGMFPCPLKGKKLSLVNPISQDLKVMRESLLPNLLENIAMNEKKGYLNLQIFEVGNVFYGVNENEQTLNIACVFAGLAREKTFLNNEEPFTIWHAKQKMLEVLFKIWGMVEASFTFKPIVSANLHTKQSFEVCLGKNVVGILGAIHPLTLEKMEIKQNAFAFELYVKNLPERRPKQRVYKEDVLGNITREIAIILPKNVLYESVFSCIKKLRIANLAEVKVNDLFEDPTRIGANLKSLLLQFTIKQELQTLTKEQIDGEIIHSITSALAKELGAKLRDGETAK